MNHPLYGTGVALVTPFTEDEQVDYSGLEKLIHYVSEDVDYLVVMGTTGESATIDFNDRRKILSFVQNHNPAGLPVVFGHGGNNTRDLIEEFDTLDLSNVEAVLSISPYYNKPSQEGIFQHFTAFADACPVPVILYNVPGRTASNILPQTTIRLSQHRNIAGIKEAAGSLEQALQIQHGVNEDFLLISGDDMLTLPFYSIGGAGVISVLANAFPRVFRNIREGFEKGDISAAKKAAASLTEINPLMYEESNPVGLKALLEMKHICGPTVRLPLVEATESLKSRLKSAYDRI